MKITDKPKEHYQKRFPWVQHGYIAKQRCINPRVESYVYCGAKGIKYRITSNDLKKIWFRDKAYNLKRPSLDRIDPRKDYEPSNCQFIELADNVKKQKIQKTSCHKGHPYIDGNFTVILQLGIPTRVCQVCRREHGKRYRDKRRAAIKKGRDQGGV